MRRDRRRINELSALSFQLKTISPIQYLYLRKKTRETNHRGKNSISLSLLLASTAVPTQALASKKKSNANIERENTEAPANLKKTPRCESAAAFFSADETIANAREGISVDRPKKSQGNGFFARPLIALNGAPSNPRVRILRVDSIN